MSKKLEIICNNEFSIFESACRKMGMDTSTFSFMILFDRKNLNKQMWRSFKLSKKQQIACENRIKLFSHDLPIKKQSKSLMLDALKTVSPVTIRRLQK